MRKFSGKISWATVRRVGVFCLTFCATLAGATSEIFAQNLFLDELSIRRSRGNNDAAPREGANANVETSAARTEFAESAAIAGATRNPSLGKIVWVDSTGKYGVVWIEREMLPLFWAQVQRETAKENAKKNAAENAKKPVPKNETEKPETPAKLPPPRTPPKTNAKPDAAKPDAGKSDAGKSVPAKSPTPAAPVFPMLATRDERLAPCAVMRVVRLNSGEQGAGLVAVRGILQPDADVFLPSPEMLDSMERNLPENVANPATSPKK